VLRGTFEHVDNLRVHVNQFNAHGSQFTDIPVWRYAMTASDASLLSDAVERKTIAVTMIVMHFDATDPGQVVV
jgi:hypothetical protein